MDGIGAEVGQKMRSAIKAKLMELGCYVDDELPDYIMVMVANKRSKAQMEDDLHLFLRSDTKVFVEWLQQVLKKLKQVTITNPDVCSTFKELKRKATMEIVEVAIKKEKKDKQKRAIAQNDNENETEVPVITVKSITDDIPVQAQRLVEKRNQSIRVREMKAASSTANSIVHEDNFDIPSLAEVSALEDSQLDLVESKIKEARDRIVLMKSDSEDDNDFINIKADGEDLLNNELDGVRDKTHTRILNLKRFNSNCNKNASTQNCGVEASAKSNKIRLAESLREEEMLSGRIRMSKVQSIITTPVVESQVEKKKRESVHKRLGLPSAVVSLPKKVHVESEKSVLSVVQVKPRRNVPALCQANKKLLLLAVAEAQKSIALTPVVGKTDKKALFTKKYREKNKEIQNKVDDEKLKNIIVQVKRKENEVQNFVDLNDDESTSISISEASEEEKPLINNQQFIVTLDGLKDEIVRKPPSPIVFNAAPSPSPSPKPKERCKYWPNCRRAKLSCEFLHPSAPCKMFPMCKFGDRCLYIHPKCKFDASCTRKDCPYSHVVISVPAINSVNANIKIPNKIVATTPPEICKYFPNCSNPHCSFYHPKPCRFGQYCLNKSECNFSHGKITNKEKFTWHAR